MQTRKSGSPTGKSVANLVIGKKRVSKNAIAQLLGRFGGSALGRFISFTKPTSLPNSVEIGED